MGGEGGVAVPTVGDAIPGCIQIGHYGPHDAAPDCLLIDSQGRCTPPVGADQ